MTPELEHPDKLDPDHIELVSLTNRVTMAQAVWLLRNGKVEIEGDVKSLLATARADRKAEDDATANAKAQPQQETAAALDMSDRDSKESPDADRT